MESFSRRFLDLAAEICGRLDHRTIDVIAEELSEIRRQGGRLFILGVGGSAGNAGHAVNDFRKLCDMEAYAPTDNVSELTARVNDEGWETVFAAWLRTSRLRDTDAIMVFSVGGGDEERNVSVNLVRALTFAQECGAKIFAIVGRDGGYAAKVADRVIIVPTVDESLVTPHAEAFQAVVWHCLVSHPALKTRATTW